MSSFIREGCTLYYRELTINTLIGVLQVWVFKILLQKVRTPQVLGLSNFQNSLSKNTDLFFFIVVVIEDLICDTSLLVLTLESLLIKISPKIANVFLTARSNSLYQMTTSNKFVCICGEIHRLHGPIGNFSSVSWLWMFSFLFMLEFDSFFKFYFCWSAFNISINFSIEIFWYYRRYFATVSWNKFLSGRLSK